MNIIETNNLTKYYGKSRGIEGLNLAVEQGDFFGFIGPNGAGKSTCIRTLLGLIFPTGGSARIFGRDVVTDHDEILKSLGYLPSEINFYHRMKVRDAIRYSASLRKKDCSKRAAELMERLNLDPDKKVDDLSLGNRKKVGILCAIQHEPELVILDEPTSGLDPLMQREFFKILTEQNERGATIFLSSHILSEVQTYCRTAAFIKDGRIILSDRVEKLEETGAKKVVLRGEWKEDMIARLQQASQEEASPPASPDLTDRSADSIPASPDGLTSITNLQIDNGYASFLYSGDIQVLLTVLAGEKLRDVTITEPTLEEIFMNYYE